MKKKALSLALALAMCLGLTVPAFATGVTGDAESTWVEYVEPIKLTLEDVAFSIDPIGVVTIQFVYEDGSAGATAMAYMFDQPASVSMKDGRNFMYGYGDAWENQVYGEGLYDGIYGLTEDDFFGIDNNSSGLWRFYLEEGNAQYDSPYMVSKSYVDSLIAEGRHKVDVQPYTASQPASPSFSDVKASDYYAEPVAWAVEKGVTAGTSKTTFSPNATCTQAQILTFLWRAKGEPKPTGTVGGTQYYAAAAQWAKEQGLTDNFSAEADCTRAMVVTYLWKLAGSPKTGTSNFSDVSTNAAYAQAVAWAVEQGITSGTSATTFSPAATCTRGQIVTFLYRAFAK